jgi:hypothetical protein
MEENLKLTSLTRQTSTQLLALHMVASTNTFLFKDALLQASDKFYYKQAQK